MLCFTVKIVHYPPLATYGISKQKLSEDLKYLQHNQPTESIEHFI